jgi:DNA uptake protein ComE-like DNA-binding protein
MFQKYLKSRVGVTRISSIHPINTQKAMKQFLSVALLATLIAPLSLPAQAKLEDNLKSVMLLFEKTRKESEVKILDLTAENEALKETNVTLEEDLLAATSRIEALEAEIAVLKTRLTKTPIREFETAALLTPKDLEAASTNTPVVSSPKDLEPKTPVRQKSSRAVPDFTPKAYRDIALVGTDDEHLSDATVLLVNLNTATERELRLIPGVGGALATRIVRNRPYESVWDLMKLEGMGKKRIETLEQYIVIE